MLLAQDRGELLDEEAFAGTLRDAVADVVAKQLDAGIDIPSDGELSKVGYATYVRHRLSGFEGEGAPPRRGAGRVLSVSTE
jgi:5-methyltetrahydropteroyltriglutamate--homocysteine methyltransferase